jgi:phosphatidylserine decarboxylase
LENRSILKLARESIPFIVIPAVLGVLALVFGFWYLTIIFALVVAFMAYFFRDPPRVPPKDSNVVVAPADGRVTRIKTLASDNGDPSTFVSIFLSPFDVHINRSPIAGEVVDISYSPGKFLMATNEKASLVNEQNALVIKGERVTVVCKQIAGILARRVVCWTTKGDNLALGQRFGMIKFSSRTDLILPANVNVTITEGRRVTGGVTVIGRIS